MNVKQSLINASILRSKAMQNNCSSLFTPRYFSTRSTSNLDTPVAVLTTDNRDNLQDKNYILYKRTILNNNAGIYVFMNNVDSIKKCKWYKNA